MLGAVSEVDDLYEIGQQNSSNKSSVSKSENATAVLGHKIEDTGQALGLTDAVDVVFYEGGDATISGFELGTDLLWFFLSSEELSKAENKVTYKGDLILDFGSVGTLTFLSMLPEAAVDITLITG